MSTILLWGGPLLETALLTGVVLRRRVTHCFTILPLTLAWLAADVLAALCPECNTWSFWTTKELVHALLTLAVGVELSWRMLVASTRGQYAALAALGVNLSLVYAFVATAPPGPVSLTLLPRLMAGQGILFLGLLWVLARHSIPLDRMHRAVLVGLATHGVFYWMTWSRTATETAVANFVNSTLFTGILAALAWAAWGRDVTPPAQLEIVKLVRPWIR